MSWWSEFRALFRVPKKSAPAKTRPVKPGIYVLDTWNWDIELQPGMKFRRKTDGVIATLIEGAEIRDVESTAAHWLWRVSWSTGRLSSLIYPRDTQYELINKEENT